MGTPSTTATGNVQPERRAGAGAVTAATGPARAPGPTWAPGPSGSSAHRGLGLALILTAAFMVVLDFSIVNVALASIERELGFSAAAGQGVGSGDRVRFGGRLALGRRGA